MEGSIQSILMKYGYLAQVKIIFKCNYKNYHQCLTNGRNLKLKENSQWQGLIILHGKMVKIFTSSEVNVRNFCLMICLCLTYRIINGKDAAYSNHRNQEVIKLQLDLMMIERKLFYTEERQGLKTKYLMTYGLLIQVLPFKFNLFKVYYTSLSKSGFKN